MTTSYNFSRNLFHLSEKNNKQTNKNKWPKFGWIWSNSFTFYKKFLGKKTKDWPYLKIMYVHSDLNSTSFQLLQNYNKSLRTTWWSIWQEMWVKSTILFSKYLLLWQKPCDVKSYGLSLHRRHPYTLHVLTSTQPATSLPTLLYETNLLYSCTIYGQTGFYLGLFQIEYFHLNSIVKFQIKYWIAMEMKNHVLKRTVGFLEGKDLIRIWGKIKLAYLGKGLLEIQKLFWDFFCESQNAPVDSLTTGYGYLYLSSNS